MLSIGLKLVIGAATIALALAIAILPIAALRGDNETASSLGDLIMGALAVLAIGWAVNYLSNGDRSQQDTHIGPLND